MKRLCTFCAFVSMVFVLGLSTASAFDYKVKYFNLSWLNPGTEYGFYGIWLVISLCGAAIIARLVIVPGGMMQSILEWPPLVFIGRISYGLYLWHNPLILIFQTHISSKWLANLIAISVTIPITLVSFYFIEKPFLRMKKRLES